MFVFYLVANPEDIFSCDMTKFLLLNTQSPLILFPLWQDAGMARGLRGEAAEISLREMLAQRALEKAEVNGEILSDMILHDVLRDTAEELESLEDEETVRREAATMHHNPTLENMYERLEQMEVKVLF